MHSSKISSVYHENTISVNFCTPNQSRTGNQCSHIEIELSYIVKMTRGSASKHPDWVDVKISLDDINDRLNDLSQCKSGVFELSQLVRQETETFYSQKVV